VPMTDLFGKAGMTLLAQTSLAPAYQLRTDSLLELIDAFDAQIGTLEAMTAVRLSHDRGYRAIQAIPGIGPVLAAVLVAEIGEVTYEETQNQTPNQTPNPHAALDRPHPVVDAQCRICRRAAPSRSTRAAGMRGRPTRLATRSSWSSSQAWVTWSSSTLPTNRGGKSLRACRG